MITLRQLRYFDSLSRNLNFGRAAAECSVTQPALSQQIRELEGELGTLLVERGKSSIALTDTGRQVARRARDILTAVGDLTDFARHRAGPLVGPLRLGVIPSIGPYLLPAILPALRLNFPNLELTVRESQTKNLVEALADGKIDLALLALPVSTPGIEQIALFDDPFFLLAPAGHPLAARQTVMIEALREENVLLLEEGHCLRDQALDICGQAAIRKVADFGATSLATVVQLVGNGYGVTILPEISLAVEARNRDGIAVSPFEAPVPVRVIGLAWRKTSPRKQDFVRFGKIVSDVHAGELAAG
jgi:LysR family hydrogen peroxide-inducible transcriptional activator